MKMKLYVYKKNLQLFQENNVRNIKLYKKENFIVKMT